MFNDYHKVSYSAPEITSCSGLSELWRSRRAEPLRLSLILMTCLAFSVGVGAVSVISTGLETVDALRLIYLGVVAIGIGALLLAMTLLRWRPILDSQAVVPTSWKQPFVIVRKS